MKDAATRALVLPYALWIAAIALTLCIGGYMTPAYVYAFKTVLCGFLLLALRPWRYASCAQTPGAVTAGALFGVVVLILWVLPEMLPWPGITEWYRRWLVMMPGTLPDYSASWCYAWQNGPALAVIKLIGSAFVIAPAEEFFFRGWLMRWLTQHDWKALPLRSVSRQAFWVTALVFAFEHDRYLVGLLAGLVYGALAVRTDSLRASVVAHVITNLLLGLYVLTAGDYSFW